ncbi:MAG TPA: hypothetical protein DHU56_13445 [Marinobacter sp.]|nr:hypothetical protein [Marinobacter sp.]
MKYHSVRLLVAQRLSKLFPLFCAHLVAELIYPWRFGQADAKEVSRRSLTGSKIKINTKDEYGYTFSLLGCYDWKLWAIAKTVCGSGENIIEVGANVGTETIGFSDIVGSNGRVYSFEPVPDNLDRLNKINSENDNISIIPMAVSDKEGELEFMFPEGANSGLGHIDYGDQFRPGKKLTVETTTVDRYFEGIPARLLMMDVEGAEPMVLKGGANWIEEYKPVIVVEAHHNREEMYSYFCGRGYSVFSIERHGLRAPKTDPQARQFNWIAIHDSEAELASKVDWAIRKMSLLPPLKLLHPLVM